MKAANIPRAGLCALVAGGTAIALAYREHLDPVAMQAALQGVDSAAPLVFMGIYVLAAVLFLPGSLLTLAGGALFGPVAGVFYSLTGATLGAVLAFLIARYVASDWVRARAGGRLKQLIEGVAGEGWRFVAFARLVPLFPFNLLNYALGLTRIRLSHYTVATYVAMVPGALAYTYLGYAGREAIAGGEDMVQKGLLALGLIVLVLFLPRLLQRLRQHPCMDVKSLKRRIDAGEDIIILDVRQQKEYQGPLGHIDGSVNVAVEDLQRWLRGAGADPDTPIALVCQTDLRSNRAVRLLNRVGFSKVAVVQGGMRAWNRAGLPIVH